MPKTVNANADRNLADLIEAYDNIDEPLQTNSANHDATDVLQSHPKKGGKPNAKA